MELLGYISSILIGISLGLIGGGGSILTVPVLVYLMGVTPLAATAYSLFIVGATSLVGGIQKSAQGSVDKRSVIIFGIPSILAVFFTRSILVPNIPSVIFNIGSFQVTRDIFIMIFFALLMVTASVSMIRSGKKNVDQTPDDE